MNTITTKIIKQDLEVAKEYIAKEDFLKVGMIGNRIMTNLLAGDREDLMIIGWFLKDLSGELNHSKEEISDERKRNMLKDSKEYIDQLSSWLDDTSANAKSLWQRYFEIEAKMRQYILSEIELDKYSNEPEFTKKFALECLEHFNTNRDLLTDKNNNLSDGIAFELGRTVNEHGGEQAFIVYMVFRAYSYCHGYFLHEIVSGLAYHKKVNKYLDEIYKMRSLIETDDNDNLYQYSIYILGLLGSDFRKSYFNYLDLKSLGEKRMIALPDRAKEKIGEIITKSLKEEMK